MQKKIKITSDVILYNIEACRRIVARFKALIVDFVLAFLWMFQLYNAADSRLIGKTTEVIFTILLTVFSVQLLFKCRSITLSYIHLVNVVNSSVRVEKRKVSHIEIIRHENKSFAIVEFEGRDTALHYFADEDVDNIATTLEAYMVDYPSIDGIPVALGALPVSKYTN